jgi:hypothetical protein
LGSVGLRRIRRLGAVVVLAIVAFYGVIILASESGEVVTLRTRDAAGGEHRTRLWVVDYGGAAWVRAGHPQKGWFKRAQARPTVELERAGTVSARKAVAVVDPAIARRVNAAFALKYGAADWIVALSGDASSRVVVRLDKAEP